MKKNKLDEILELGSFLKELAEEGDVRLGFAKELGINPKKLLKIEGGRNTFSMDTENGTFTPEKLAALDDAIQNYLMNEDDKNKNQKGYQSKLDLYYYRILRWKKEKGEDYWEERKRKWALFREKLPYNSISRKSAQVYKKFIKVTTL